MNLLFSCIGRRGYVASWFREQLAPGDRIVGTTNTLWTPGLHACDQGVLMPDLESPEYLPALLELCRKLEIHALFSFFDLDVDAIARERERFVALGVVPVVPDARASRIGLDKLETVKFLREHGFRAPRTFTELEAARAALRDGSLRYPVFVKPRRGFASQNLFLARSDDELRVFFAYAPDMIVQERLGGSEHSLDVLNDLEGRVVSVIVKRKVLMRAGETDQAETIHHPGALEFGERLGRALGHVGPLDVDLFIDGDALTVLELNPRFGGGYPAAHLAGADFPRKILAMLRGERVEPDLGRYAAGMHMLKDYAIRSAYAGELVDLRPRSAAR
jgi:carbamoyl-phosphate synthase large subunit